ncbi:hypothetical protein TASI_1551 [Taylorella asinigenitalis MCE3]|uniref:Uncharacterized protein n=1 Tax=Taylorella asinigenitalis (strain MCE3) TaxID=1008459 RepID=G4QBU4_TAYAM|nr:hypothetical protein TASI_1551 [Taylorella asinigenitalis MCE3]
MIFQALASTYARLIVVGFVRGATGHAMSDSTGTHSLIRKRER